MTSKRALRTGLLSVLALMLAVAASASASGGGPKTRHVAADVQLARSVLLGTSDLHTWVADSPTPAVDPLTCSQRLTPSESDLVESGSAFSPFFVHGTKEAVAQSAHVYVTAAQADAAWARRTLKKTVLCMQRRLEDSSTMMSWISAAKWDRLAPPQLVPRAAGYRVIGDAQAGKQKAKVYFDVFLLARDRTLTMVVTTSYGKALPKPFEQELLRAVSERLLAT
jgi:hypothetical protein